MHRQGQQFKARFSPDIKAWIEEKAQQQDRSQTWIINHYLREAMRREDKSTAA